MSEKNHKKDKREGIMKRFTNAINTFLENSFAKCGLIVGTHPIKTIIISLVFAMVCLAGLSKFQQEQRREKLWVDQNSQYTKDQDWIRSEFPIHTRPIGMMVKTSDILTKEGLKILFDLDDMVKKVYSNSSTKNWKQMKFDIPTLSLLEFWDFNRTIIETLTKDDILRVVNKASLFSLTRNHNVTISKYISHIKGNRTHPIITAGVAHLQYFIKHQIVFDKALGNWADERGKDWEIEFAKIVKRKKIPGVKIFYSTLQSFFDATQEAVNADIKLLFSGYVLIILYVAFMLGSFSSLQQKIWLAIVGIICVVLSIGVTIGICSAAKVIYGPVHSVLPFILLGIGVDDVFVIIQMWQNVAGSIHDDEPIPEKISRTMRHAGATITVTSFTDVCAFLIGASTVMPALSSFCIYIGFGILMLYVFVSTFFVAFLTIDAHRQRNRREACLCIKLPADWSPLACSQKNYLQTAFSNFAKCTVTIPGKVIIILMTSALLALGGYGLSRLDQNFEYDWLLPKDSDEFQYRSYFKKYFPSDGVSTISYVGDIDYFADQKKLHMLYNKMVREDSIKADSVASWYEHFINYVAQSPRKSLHLHNDIITHKEKFYTYLKEFLDTNGRAFRSNLKYIENETAIVSIKASRITMTHKNIPDVKKQVEAMDSVRHSASSVVFSTGTPRKAFVFCIEYITWYTNKIVIEELTRNLSLAGACVFVVTLFLIANFWTSLLVLICVALSLIDICGFMYYWNMSLDMLISTILVGALGFAVDYSGHIGHAFMAARKGTRNERAVRALEDIGPAVLNGGISTFLAICLLSASELYAFQTFFKVFFLVVTIGLFHGLVFLPVLLSIVGPRAYNDNGETKTTPAIECKAPERTQDVQLPTKEKELKCTITQGVGKQKCEVVQGVDNLTFVES